MSKNAKEDLLQKKLDRALAPYAKLLPPEKLAEYRLRAEEFATTHPVMARMLARLREPPVESDVFLKPGVEEDAKKQGVKK